MSRPETVKQPKPLGRKSYGSIGHLPSSRMGPGDHHVTEGQARICTEKARDRHDRIIVQEKVDGSCVAVAKVQGDIMALGRAGYLAETSRFEQHHMFAGFVADREALFADILDEGERLVGEWLAQAHGTRYELAEYRGPFVAFDIMRDAKRLPYAEFMDRVGHLETPPCISDGPALSVDAALTSLGTFGRYGALDPVEGVVYRVERKGVVDYLAKYVRPDKVDGVYLPEVSGLAAVWNWGEAASATA